MVEIDNPNSRRSKGEVVSRAWKYPVLSEMIDSRLPYKGRYTTRDLDHLLGGELATDAALEEAGMAGQAAWLTRAKTMQVIKAYLTREIADRLRAPFYPTTAALFFLDGDRDTACRLGEMVGLDFNKATKISHSKVMEMRGIYLLEQLLKKRKDDWLPEPGKEVSQEAERLVSQSSVSGKQQIDFREAVEISRPEATDNDCTHRFRIEPGSLRGPKVVTHCLNCNQAKELYTVLE